MHDQDKPGRPLGESPAPHLAGRLVFREVTGQWIAGRGRWWRPDGKGYTNDLVDAGLYPASGYGSGEGRDVGRCVEVDAVVALEEEIRAVNQRHRALVLLLVAAHVLPTVTP